MVTNRHELTIGDLLRYYKNRFFTGIVDWEKRIQLYYVSNNETVIHLPSGAFWTERSASVKVTIDKFVDVEITVTGETE